MSDQNESIHGIWTSRWVFILAATGSAVGLGNIWKFPYITGENGGGAFVLIYLVCIVLIGIPILMVETMLGRRGRKSPINAMSHLIAEAKARPWWKIIGYSGTLAGFLILSYYSVIAGWALYYGIGMVQGQFAGLGAIEVQAVFDGLVASPYTLLAYHTLFMVMTMGVLARGVNKGIGKAVSFLMPCLFILLAILLAYSFSTGRMMDAAEFMFSFDVSKLSKDSILVAMGHAFFTLSLGMGAIMVYGAYMPQNASIASTALTVGFFDTLVALIAGLCIFPIVYKFNLDMSSSDAGLLFRTLPIAFAQMEAGMFFGAVFFLLVTFAAWSSAISLIEPVVAWLVESGHSRVKASIVSGVLCWFVGIGTLLSFNEWSGIEYQLQGKTFFAWIEYITANFMLPLGGVFMAIFAGWVMKDTKVMKELKMESEAMYVVFRVIIRIVAPIAVLVVIVNALK